ncbi:MAG: hypothetical protein J7M26_01315, partial [Armatimonadetes bacterium]|nr:hypothetical protein [Armatimonadota bacterium]
MIRKGRALVRVGYLVVLGALVVGLLPVTVLAEDKGVPWYDTPQAKARRLAWFRKARFGMFIHWGI